MVQSARQLLHEPTQTAALHPPSLDEPCVSLRDFMDSFPLVPLAIIPRLGLADLCECEAGLLTLYQTLDAETNAEDAQLGKYIARQLGLVQRHMEQARARARVLKLLSGEVPTTLGVAATTSICTRATSNSSMSSSSKSLPVFLQPASPVFSTRASSGGPRQPLLAVKSTSSLLQPSAKRPPATSQLAKAKAIAKTSLTAAFVITTSENSLKARQKKNKKKTNEQIEAQRARQQEREKEKRRQAAYQRLLARQALQAKKKQEAEAKKMKKQEFNAPSQTLGGLGGPNECTTTVGSFVAVTTMQGSSAAHVDDGTSSSSDESDVSNCSETDAANEQAILEMPLTLKGDEEHSHDANQEVEAADQNADNDNDGGPNDDESEEVSDPDDGRVEVDEQVEVPSSSDARPEVDGHVDGHDDDTNKVEPGDDRASQASEESTVHILDGAAETPRESEEAVEERSRGAIAMQLAQFVTERTQSALDQLRSRHVQTPPAVVRPTESSSRPPTAPRGDFPPREVDRVAPPSPTSATPEEADAIATDRPSLTKKRPLPITGKSKSTKQSSTKLVLPRLIGRDLQDYRGFFANFFCILTSVYEQRVAYASGSTNGSTSSSSLVATSSLNATLAGDNALRLQLKLYQSWQSIMSDYATVFGSSIPTPGGLFTSSTPTSSPYSAHYRINSSSRKEVSDIVVTALEKLSDWEEHPSGLGLKTTWNLLWTWSKPNVERKTLLAWQKVNHFQHAKALTRKDCLKKNIGKYLAVGGRLKQAYDIVPASFLLPHEYVAFVQAFQERSKAVPPGKNIWIMKPVALSRGRGISLVNDLNDVVYGEPVVIQEYIANPLLLDGFKFDLRLYVLVTSFNPLEAFFYEEGFVRMCTRAYEDSDLTNLFIHLTNSSIQKENQDAIAATPENPINAAQHDSEAGGTKMTLAYLWKRLASMGADVAAVKSEVLSVILKSLLCGEDHIPFQVNSFDLLGYDILLDTNFRPWLIEINSSPSMARENDLDFQVKDALIHDSVRLVNPLHFDRVKLVEVIARRFHDAETEKQRSHANTRHPREAEELAARQLNEDLTEILRGHVPRAYGDMPEHTGSYTRIAPHTTLYNQLAKLKKSCLRLDRK